VHARGKTYLKDCDRDIIDCFSECAKNVLNNVTLKKDQFDRLKKKKTDVRKSAHHRTLLKHFMSEGRIRNVAPRTCNNSTRLRNGGTAVSAAAVD